MADAISIQELIDARTDAKTLEEAVNGDAVTTVLSRLGETYPTLSNALSQIDGKLDSADAQIKQGITDLFENGGLPATPFKTKALMIASALVDGKYAQVTDDTVNNGLYVKTAGSWVKSGYDPLTQAKVDATARVEAGVATSKSYTDNEHVKTIEYYPNSTALLATTPKLPGQVAFVKDEGSYYKYEEYIKPQQAETTALISRFSVKPSPTTESVINRLIYDLKQAGVWDKLDGLWIGRTMSFADSKLNWVSNKYNLVTAESEPTHFNIETSAFSFINNKFDTLLNPLTSTGLKSSQESITIGSLMFKGQNLQKFLGAYNDTSGIVLEYDTPNNIFGARLNQVDRVTATPLPSSSEYLTLTATRIGDNVEIYQDNTRLVSEREPSVTPLDSTIKIGKVSDTYKSTGGGVYAVFVASAMTSKEVAATDKALRIYRDRFAKTGLGVGMWEKELEVATDSSIVSNYVFDGETTVVTPTANLTGVVDESIINQEYMGGYVEIQPDSWTGTHNTATDATTETWGFPQSLTNPEQARLRKDLFKGDGKGLQYIRFPLGYAYRGYRNIDETTGLARNIGERYLGQDAALRKLFADISKAGGGLAPEYWCPPVYWLTSGSYHGNNQITAGGRYSQSVPLPSIRTTDPIQYAAQIDAFTDAVVDDYEYLHQNIAPVRMYGLSNEPSYTKLMYGACGFDAETYSDIVLALHPKVQSSAILSEWNGEPNKVLLHVASDDKEPYWSRAAKLESEHPEYIWGYTHHMIRQISGESIVAGAGKGGDYYKSTNFAETIGTRKNVFLNEYEYFNPTITSHTYKCSNNMLAYINSVIYSDSRLIMPIIHVSKQLGATSLSTNTEGYALTQVNLQEGYGLAPSDPTNTTNAGYGTYRPVDHNYNAWRFIADNLPIGAVRIGGVPANNLARVNYVVYKFENKAIVLIVNSNAEPVDVTLTFDKARTYYGKVYNVNQCGAVLKPKDGQTITFTVPAHSGQAWVEV